MHLKPISRELRRELYGRRRKRYKHIRYKLHLSACVGVFLIEIHHRSFFTSSAVTGLDLDQERGDLAQGTEVEEAEAAATTRDAAPETESVQDVSEPQAMTTRPSLPRSIPSLFFKFVPFQLHSRTNWEVPDFEAVTALMNMFFLDFWKWLSPH